MKIIIRKNPSSHSRVDVRINPRRGSDSDTQVAKNVADAAWAGLPPFGSTTTSIQGSTTTSIQGSAADNERAALYEKHDTQIKAYQDRIDAANATLKVLAWINHHPFPGTTFKHRVCTPSIKAADGRLEEIRFAWNQAPSSSSYTWDECQWVAEFLAEISAYFGSDAIEGAAIKVTVDDPTFFTPAQAEADAMKHMDMVWGREHHG